ncbi:MAG: hypothetical protein ACLQFR_08930 [Streptosporangiaceae bacterium]
MPNTVPHTNINLPEVNARNDNARHIIAGYATALPTLTDMWRNVLEALNDTPALAAEITRLSAELGRTRLDCANLRAAMRATLAAHADGEPDPMWYLRDALNAPETATRRRP